MYVHIMCSIDMYIHIYIYKCIYMYVHLHVCVCKYMYLVALLDFLYDLFLFSGRWY